MDIINSNFLENSFNLIDQSIKFASNIPIAFFKSLVFLISILISGWLIVFWIKFEKETKDEIGFWNSIIKNWKDYKFIKEFKKKFNLTKRIFNYDKKRSILLLIDLTEKSLETFGYEGTIEEKFNKLNQIEIFNKEKIGKILEIIKIIKENEDLKVLDDEDYLVIFHELEKILCDLKLINIEDFLVKNQE